MNLLLAADSSVSSSFEVSVNPSSYANQVGNGSFTTPAFSAVVANNAGDVSYLWTVEDLSTGDVVDILSPTSSSTRLSVSGSSMDVVFTLKCTATDDNGDTSSSANIVLFFGEVL